MIKRLIKKLYEDMNRRTEFKDVEPWQMEIVARIRPYTMTSLARIFSTINAVEHVVRHDIEGAIVECGVWKGGNMMAAALTLQHLKTTRPIYLFDTFSGMTAPEDADKDAAGNAAEVVYSKFKKKPNQTQWCEASIEEVRANMASTNYPADLVHFIKGPVESTLPASAPGPIAVLRLDTDWYASTLHELVHLYPLVLSRGIVIIDDYGHWQGARRAVDEFLQKQNITALLHRIDLTGREFVKP